MATNFLAPRIPSIGSAGGSPGSSGNFGGGTNPLAGSAGSAGGNMGNSNNIGMYTQAPTYSGQNGNQGLVPNYGGAGGGNLQTSYGTQQNALNNYYRSSYADQNAAQNLLAQTAANGGNVSPQMAAQAGYNPAGFAGGKWNYGNVSQMVGGLMPGDPGYNDLLGQQTNLSNWSAGPGSAQNFTQRSVSNDMLNGGNGGGFSQSQIYNNGANAQSNTQLAQAQGGSGQGQPQSPQGPQGILPTRTPNGWGPQAPYNGPQYGGFNSWGQPLEGNPYSYMTGISNNGFGNGMGLGYNSPGTFQGGTNPLSGNIGSYGGFAQLLSSLLGGQGQGQSNMMYPQMQAGPGTFGTGSQYYF